MQIVEYKSGDIIRLSPEGLAKIESKIIFQQNLFKISQIKGETVILRYYDEVFMMNEILPVKINGIEDKDVYYDPIVAASVVLPGEVVPHCHRDADNYYLDDLKNINMSDGRSYYETIHNDCFSYVHEIQHEFPELRLEINYSL